MARGWVKWLQNKFKAGERWLDVLRIYKDQSSKMQRESHFLQ